MAGSSSDRGHTSFKYDVFISFRGSDTRKSFISHLYEALLRKKIKAYKDDVSLPRGDEISSALLNAIESSKISIVVLSRHYATSRWCLEELVHILKCKRERAHIVLPVFYGVDPSDVRKQKESYASAFDDHEKRFKDQMEKVIHWRSALAEIGNLSGWDSRQNRPESELVEEIAQVILLKLYNMSSKSGDEIDKKFIGMEERVKKIESLLCIDSPDVRIVGIWGMGGIGKSTIAQVVLNRFSSTFDSCLFVDVSNEVKWCGLAGITEKIFSTLLKDKAVDMYSSYKDVRLQRSKVFLVLDNVDDVEQLEILIGDCEETKSRFGEGSRIIVTSRDKKLLMECADDIYEVDALGFSEATKLFYQNAFRRDSSKVIDYIELSKRFVDYTGGNPLALKVLGSLLHLRSVKEWESALCELKKAPNEKVQKVLRISYDALDHVKQSTFLDIACFHKGEDRKFVEDILEDDSHIVISVLIERSLVTIIEGRLSMHDLIQEMAWEIVRRESLELGKRSRLWVAQDVYSVLKRNKGSSRIEGISLDLSQISRDLSLNSGVFEDMENLRLLKVYNGHNGKRKMIYLHQGLQYLPDSLRYLKWAGYPLSSLPSDFEPQNMVKLDMSESKVEKLWSGVEHLPNLKHLTLTASVNLRELPDLSQTPKLERMNLNLCTQLRQFPKISGNLNYLSMYDSGVEEFHSSFESLENLHHLYLSGCKRLKSLPKFPRHIRTLHLGMNPYIANFLSFEHCSQQHCFPCLLLVLNSLTDLDLSHWGISHIPDQLDVFVSMESLNLSGNDFKEIPSSIKQMCKLKNLNIKECKNLKSLPDLPNLIQSIDARGCVSLEAISARGCTSLKKIEATQCVSLMEIDTDERGCSSWRELLTASREAIIRDRNNDRTYFLSFYRCSKLDQSAKDSILSLFQREIFGLATSFHPDFEATSAWKTASAHYPGDEIPKWFAHQNEGPLLNLTLQCQRHHVNNLTGFAACVVIALSLNNAYLLNGYVSCKLRFKTRSGGLHECHEMDCGLKLEHRDYGGEEGVERYVFMWCFSSGPAYDAEAALGLKDEAVEALFDFRVGNAPPDGGVIKIERCGIRMISLQGAEEFGFGVEEASRASVRRWTKPTRKLNYLQARKKKRE